MAEEPDLDAIEARYRAVWEQFGSVTMGVIGVHEVLALVAECRRLRRLVEDAALLPQVWRLMGEKVDRLRAGGAGNRMDAAILEVALEAWRRREGAGE